MAKKNIQAYQIDLHYLGKKEDGNEVDKVKWDADKFEKVLKHIHNKSIHDRQKKFNGWFTFLDELIIEDKVILGKFRYAEYGFKSDLIHSETLLTRENPRNIKEGEEKYIHFFVRKLDGLLLIQGDIKLNRAKVSEYINSIGEEEIQKQGLTFILVSYLLRKDFFAELEALERSKAFILEVTKESLSGENEVIRELQNQVMEMEGNEVQLIFQAKYLKKGLQKVNFFVNKYKDKPGIKNIKVVGNQSGAERIIDLDKQNEKYTGNFQTDENNMVISEDMYSKMREIGEGRHILGRRD